MQRCLHVLPAKLALCQEKFWHTPQESEISRQTDTCPIESFPALTLLADLMPLFGQSLSSSHTYLWLITFGVSLHSGFFLPTHPPCDRFLATFTLSEKFHTSNYVTMICSVDFISRTKLFTTWRCECFVWEKLRRCTAAFPFAGGSYRIPPHANGVIFFYTSLWFFSCWLPISDRAKGSSPPPL